MLDVKEREIIVKLHNNEKSQEEISKIIGCSQPTVHRWIKHDLAGRTLQTLPRSGRPTMLNKAALGQLREEILAKIKSANSEYCSVSTKQVKDIIHQEVGEDYSMRHIERIMHRLGFSLITPRPQHLRHDQEKVDRFRDEFKKNLRWSMWTMN